MSETLVLDEQNTRADLTLQLSRTIKAERRRVFEAWTRPELMSQWFAPGEMTVTSASADLRVGGSYKIDINDPSAVGDDGKLGRKGGTEGIYRKIVPNELLSFTWQGNCGRNEETVVTVAFKDVEEGTEVTITHEHFQTAESMNRHQKGWDGCLANLVRFAEK
jgi:uncharacterized protein YndB with AHSA1/START domain